MLVRILLDTCTVRNHLHGLRGQLDFKAINSSSEELRFSLPGGTGAELIEQLTKGRITWSEWINGIPAIESILDQRWPLLPTGRQLAAIAETQTDIAINIEDERRHLGAVWRQLRHAKSTSDLQCIERYEGADRRQYGVTLDLSRPYKVCKAERNKWIHYIHHIQSLVKSSGLRNPSESEIVSLMKKDLGTQPGDLPDLGDKLDSVSRMIARLVCESLKTKDAYNPDAERRRGDAFDISLLFYTSLPSVVCTTDQKLVNRLRGTGSLHSCQVVSVDECNQLVRDGSLGTLVRAFRTPDEQHSRWQEAAYYNWIARGRPIGDDLRDWLDAEPLA